MGLVIRRSTSELQQPASPVPQLNRPPSTDLQLSGSTIGTNENFSVTVTVQNTGKRDGKEVVQVCAFGLLPGNLSVTCLGICHGPRKLRCYAEPTARWVSEDLPSVSFL